jgi:hypothetical protein
MRGDRSVITVAAANMSASSEVLARRKTCLLPWTVVMMTSREHRDCDDHGYDLVIVDRLGGR